jgi:hypothetical protein
MIFNTTVKNKDGDMGTSGVRIYVDARFHSSNEKEMMGVEFMVWSTEKIGVNCCFFLLVHVDEYELLVT